MGLEEVEEANLQPEAVKTADTGLVTPDEEPSKKKVKSSRLYRPRSMAPERRVRIGQVSDSASSSTDEDEVAPPGQKEWQTEDEESEDKKEELSDGSEAATF